MVARAMARMGGRRRMRRPSAFESTPPPRVKARAGHGPSERTRRRLLQHARGGHHVRVPPHEAIRSRKLSPFEQAAGRCFRSRRQRALTRQRKVVAPSFACIIASFAAMTARQGRCATSVFGCTFLLVGEQITEVADSAAISVGKRLAGETSWSLPIPARDSTIDRHTSDRVPPRSSSMIPMAGDGQADGGVSRLCACFSSCHL